jgi:carboxylesterase type B
MVHVWTSFARTGTSQLEDFIWPKWSGDEQRAWLISSTPHSTATSTPGSEHHCAFWDRHD